MRAQASSAVTSEDAGGQRASGGLRTVTKDFPEHVHGTGWGWAHSSGFLGRRLSAWWPPAWSCALGRFGLLPVCRAFLLSSVFTRLSVASEPLHKLFLLLGTVFLLRPPLGNHGLGSVPWCTVSATGPATLLCQSCSFCFAAITWFHTLRLCVYCVSSVSGPFWSQLILVKRKFWSPTWRHQTLPPPRCFPFPLRFHSF